MNTINLNNIKRSIALISDTHVFSDFALVPRDPVYDEHGGMLNVNGRLNKGQREIQSYWYDHWLPTCDKFAVDTVMHFGDAIQGCNPKEGGVSSLTPDMNYQKEGFVEVMKPLVKDRILHQFSGTKYHEALNVKIHSDTTDSLRKFAKKAIFHGKFANIKFEGTEKIANCAHKATGATIYPTTMIDRELVFVQMAAGGDKIPRADYFIRGHLHRFMHIDDGVMHGIQLPGWQSWYPLGDSVRLYGRVQPDIGGVILLIDKMDRTIILHFLYPTPKIGDSVKAG
ncbi:MAG: hypothetical protein ACXABF_16445 [Candidatus Thorarchaeota archaeon]